MKRTFFSLLVLALILSEWAVAQDAKPVEQWHHLDRIADKYNGVSTAKAYEFLKGKKSRTVVVAVIDSGVDTDHEDLRENIWVNEDEIAGNGIDDDKNGYIDDIHGWNFIGDVVEDTYESTRLFVKFSKQFEGRSEDDISRKEKEDYALYQKLKREIEKQVSENSQQLSNVENFHSMYVKSARLIRAYLDTEELTAEEVGGITSADPKVTGARDMVKYALDNGFTEEDLEEYLHHLHVILDFGYNLEFDSRKVLGDDYDDPFERYYGNSKLYYEGEAHGTQVAGVIAAVRDNNIGTDGIADNVKIMVIRAIPNGDERDKDVANAILYAVDNGAHIINMSFGKRFSPEKEAVDKAVAYAESKGVLLVHAAGNDGKDIDIRKNYPSKVYGPKKVAKGWVSVGASSWGEGDNFVASFSNYGKTNVDVFAPGVSIYCPAPGNEYSFVDGTSFASPLTAGVAALVMSYYPSLSADQVADIILKSSVKFQDLEVNKPGEYEGDPEMIAFKELSVTGGIVNAYEAVKMAESLQVGSR